MRRLPLLFITLWIVTTAQAGNPWSKIDAPTSGPAAAIGGAANGCLQGAAQLPARGVGFVDIRRSRHRYYGHPDTIAFVETLGAALYRQTGESLLVGDLSQPRGGLMSSSHRSHQNGLDVDLWFQVTRHPETAGRRYSEGNPPPSFVRRNGRDLSRRWGASQRFMLYRAARDPRVDRIFVNPAIKRALCRSERGDRGWLRKLRPWWGHDAHFHVRLRCPKGSPHCRAQAPIPAGPGCGATLAWWFTEEARHPKKKGATRPRPKPPHLCRRLLRGE